MKQQAANDYADPQTPEDALLHIARNTARQVELTEKTLKALSSIAMCAGIITIIMVCSILFSFYVSMKIDSAAQTARVNQMIEELGIKPSN